MFINFNIFRKLKLTEEFVFFLLAVKSEDKEYIENFNDKQKSLEEGYIKQIKSGDYRLDKKGKEILNKLSKSLIKIGFPISKTKTSPPFA